MGFHAKNVHTIYFIILLGWMQHVQDYSFLWQTFGK